MKDSVPQGVRLKSARLGLKRIARDGCHTFIGGGTCRDQNSGRWANGKYLADRWCVACVAADALEKSK